MMKNLKRMIVGLYNRVIRAKGNISKPIREQRQRRLDMARREQRTFVSYIRQIRSHIEIDPESFIPSRVFVNKKYEPDLVYYLKRTLQPGMTCVDAGANVGYLSLLMAKRVGRLGRVISFEPTQRSFSALCRNIDMNKLANVSCEQVALADYDGTLDFHEGPFGYDVFNSAGIISQYFLRESSITFNNTTVPCIRLDSYFATKKIKEVDLIKIDIEGGELSALKGMEITLMRNPQALLFIEFHDQTTAGFGYQAREIGSWLEERGWQLSIIKKWGRTESALSDRPWNGEIVVVSKVQ